MIASLGFSFAVILTTTVASVVRKNPWSLTERNIVRIRGGANSRDDGPYSFSLTTFSPRGSLSQIEYAMNSALGGALSVAITYDNGIVMASVRKAESSLVMDVGTRKIAWVSDGVAVSYAGLAADSRVLTTKAQECCLEYRGKFGKDAAVPIGLLVSEMAMVLQEYTQMGGVRPFGVALLVASVEANGTRLYRLEPSGSYSAWKACAIGSGSAEAEAILHDQFKESMDRDRAVELVLSTVLRCAPSGVREQDVEIVCVEQGKIEPLNTLGAR